jgi:NAD(P)-dependent dehydrogenase (short-subunit alcohol dehydrogenase family)
VAPALLTRAALPHLRDRRDAVVNVSSTFGHRPRRRVPPTETQILAQSGLTAEAIEAIKADEVRRIPLGRRGTPTTWRGGSSPSPTRQPTGSPARSSPSTAASTSSRRPRRTPVVASAG